MTKITHEEAREARLKIKKLLNSMHIDPSLYAKDLNILLDYIKQQEELTGVREE